MNLKGYLGGPKGTAGYGPGGGPTGYDAGGGYGGRVHRLRQTMKIRLAIHTRSHPCLRLTDAYRS